MDEKKSREEQLIAEVFADDAAERERAFKKAVQVKVATISQQQRVIAEAQAKLREAQKELRELRLETVDVSAILG